jgi:tetratricopeptide (TPR) repeat protein
MKAIAFMVLLATPLAAQTRPGGPMQEAIRLDLAGETTKARAIIQTIIDTSAAPAGKAAAQRAIAMSYAFDGNCNETVRYERLVIDYWKTREAAEPQNAFFQEGEMANEAARVCIDVGALDTALSYYKTGARLGRQEPAPATHPQALWDFRLSHALARIAARHGDKAEALRQVDSARHALDIDATVRAQQERFFPYLLGYVALYTNDPATAERQLNIAVSTRGNENDPFMRLLLGMTYERLGKTADARAAYEKAASLATGHNPPSAYVHHYLATRKP